MADVLNHSGSINIRDVQLFDEETDINNIEVYSRRDGVNRRMTGPILATEALAEGDLSELPEVTTYDGDNDYLLIRASGVQSKILAGNFEGTTGDSSSRYSDNGVYIKATGAGVTASIVTGVMTITVPDGVELESIGYEGSDAGLAGDDSFSVVINYEWDNGMNTGIANMAVPSITLLNTAAQSGGGPSGTFPFIISEAATPEKRVVAVGSNSITILIANLNAFTNWHLTLINS